MQFQFRFDEGNMRTVCDALAVAALWYAEGLESIPAGEYEGYREDIDEWREVISHYLGLRRRIMKCQAMTRSEEDAKIMMDQEADMLKMVVDEWNGEIRRIKQTEGSGGAGGGVDMT